MNTNAYIRILSPLINVYCEIVSGKEKLIMFLKLASLKNFK